jgi:iron complex outermembrane recepter protein
MNRHAKGAGVRKVLAGFFFCISLCVATLSLAQSRMRQYEVDIPVRPLTQALQQFSAQTQLQHGYLPTDEAEERILVGPVQGYYTADEILTKLLPAGFTFEWIDTRTVSIVPPPTRSPPGGVDQEVTATDHQRAAVLLEQQLSMAFGDGRGGSARSPYHWDDRIVVEASRILDSGLDLDVPTRVIDREQIQASGASTIVDLLKQVTQQPFILSEPHLGDGTQFADLRGLGFDTTLVLINGRRTIATASSLSFNAFDLNSIPLAVVERIEIISDSTSAIHGADAIGGVFNIVLRDDVPEPTLDIDYGAAAGGAVERHAALSASGSGKRARGSVVFDYFDRGPLLGRERDRWANQDFTRFGGMDWRSPTASPGNVSSISFANLPGLSSSFAAIPAFGVGTSLTPTDFLPMAEQRNLESLYQYNSVLYEGTRKGAMAQGEYHLTPGVSAFGELLYVDRDNTREVEPPALTGVIVPATNPYNPFSEDVRVDTLIKDLGPRLSTRSAEMFRVVAGGRGRVRDWDWEVSLHKSQDDDTTVRTKELDPARVAAALAATDTDHALNVFGASGANSPQLLASLLAEPARSRFLTEATQAIAYAGGPLFSVPAGRVTAIVGGEWRDDHVQYDIAAPADLAGSHDRSVAAAFAEVRVPFVGPAAKVPAMHELSLIVSGRVDRYSDVGDSFNPQYALIWQPVSALTLRSSFADSFRPPSLFDLYMPLVQVPVPTADPARNGEFAFPIWAAGGNRDLQPSNANSFTTSVLFAPAGRTDLRIAANYWRIRIDDTVGVPSASRLLAAEDRFPGRIIRGEPSAADLAAGLPGPLQMIDVTRLNSGTIRTSGTDYSASFVLDTRVGRFVPSLSATWVHDFVTSDLIDGPGITRVGVANLQGSIARWKAAAGMAWSRRGIGVSSTVRYVPSYDDVDIFGHRNGREVHSQSVVDVQLSLDLGEMASQDSHWSGFEIRAGCINLFDEEPPFAEVGLLGGYDTSQGDLRQRFAYLKLAKKF